MMGSSIIQFLIASFLLFTFLNGSVHANKKSYVVYLGGHSHGPDPSPSDLEYATNSHYDLLSSVLGSHEKAKEAMFYSYNKHINGFAAKLEDQEAAEIAKNPNVVSVFLDKAHTLHTTRSWEFLGLDKQGILPAGSAWKRARYGEKKIIANIDTGVWPESRSFSDKGVGPIPAKWRGICQLDKFRYNRKLIGARIFHKGYEEGTGHKLNRTLLTARDYNGHGSHTLSTAGGNFVPNATVLRQGNGTAKGGSPRAHVVAYKVCWEGDGGYYDTDMLDAFDHAICDGVDVISIPLGTTIAIAEELFTSGIAIGAFHAIAKNIVVVASAGNNGPDPGTVANVAPWVFTVAASTIDRQITSNVALGSKNQTVKGASLNLGPSRRYYSPIRGEDAKLPNARTVDAQYCRPGTLDPNKVRGKALICSRGPSISSATACDRESFMIRYQNLWYPHWIGCQRPIRSPTRRGSRAPHQP